MASETAAISMVLRRHLSSIYRQELRLLAAFILFAAERPALANWIHTSQGRDTIIQQDTTASELHLSF